MRTDRYLATNLRKQGKSYKEISRSLDIPLSTLCYWFKNNAWSQIIKTELINKAQVLNRRNFKEGNLRLMLSANKIKWDAWHKQCRESAKNKYPILRNNTLFIAGLMLYWGEGDKVLRNDIVRMVNSDPSMIKIYYLFLRRCLGIPAEKIILKLTLYPDLNDKSTKLYWSNFLNVPLIQFRKSVTIIGKHPTRLLSCGVCSVDVYSRELKEKIFTWIELYKQTNFQIETFTV